MKTYRIYFNREREWPQCWSVDEGTQASEINVVGFQLAGVEALSKTLPRDARASFDNSPFAWLEVRNAELRLDDGVAHFLPPLTPLKM